jgi:choline dehydrogenase-like flavoprotein
MEGPVEWLESLSKNRNILNRPQRVYIGCEQSPNYKSRIKLGDNIDKYGQKKALLDWRLNEFDQRSINNTVNWFSRMVGIYGIGRFQIGEDLKKVNWEHVNSPIAGGYHHMGTTRMGDNIRESVVNKDSKYHQLNNLYIAGSSVFPTGGSTNPTLTIVALALRLAEHLKLRFN